MSWSLKIGSVAGTAIRVHISFLLVLILVANSYSSGGAAAAWRSSIFIILLFVCVLAHEFGHVFAGRAFGIATPAVTLLPIGGVAHLERIPDKPHQDLLVSIAGPAVNFIIAIGLVTLAGAKLASLAAFASPRGSLIDRLAAVNVLLALFNLIPAYPLDGGQALRALLATRMDIIRATEIAARIGEIIALALGLIGLLSDRLLLITAIIIYVVAREQRIRCRRIRQAIVDGTLRL